MSKMSRDQLIDLLQDIYLEGYHCGCKGDFTEYLEHFYPELLELINEQTK